MNKPLYKKVRVIHNPHRAEFIIEYKSWLTWKYDRKFMYYEQGKNPGFDKVFSKDEAQRLAIERAEEILDKHIIFEKSNFVYYV